MTKSKGSRKFARLSDDDLVKMWRAIEEHHDYSELSHDEGGKCWACRALNWMVYQFPEVQTLV